MLRKLGKSNQVAIPKEIVDALDLKTEDYLDVYVEDNRIILEPKVLIARDQVYFYAPEWQKEEREAEEDIEAGRVTKTKDLDDLFAKMDS